jgi:transcriptional antiterminator NusG
VNGDPPLKQTTAMADEIHEENPNQPTDHPAEVPPSPESGPGEDAAVPIPIPAPEPPPIFARAEEVVPEPEPGEVSDEAPAEEPAPAEDAAPATPPVDEKKHWYIVKVQSGREESIKEAIERRVKIEGLEEYFGQIKIPVEKVTELRNGKRVVRSRKKFPGYLMAHVEFNDRILYLFRETSGVGDFVGATVNRAPSPMPSHEVDRMLADEAIAAGDTKGKAIEKIKLKFDKGDRVRVRDGTFQGMEGEVKEILEPKEAKDPVRVRIELTIFGRPVPVEVEAWQVDPA